MTRYLGAAALITGLTLAGCAGAPNAAAPTGTTTPASAGAGGRACFWASQVNSWTSSEDEETAYLKVGVKDVYKVELFGRCMDLDTAQTIGLQSRSGGDSVCDGSDVVLIVGSSLGPQRCLVTRMSKLTPEEIAALPPKLKP